MFGKLETHYRKKIGERKAELEKQMEERQRQKEQMVQKRKEEVEKDIGKFQDSVAGQEKAVGMDREEARKKLEELERIKRSS